MVVTVVWPAGSVDVEMLAFPFPRFTVPKTVVPAVKVTDPVGTTVADCTTAVNFTV